MTQFAQKVQVEDMTMLQLKPYLCGKSAKDPCVCIDCSTQCIYGKQAIKLMDTETAVGHLTRKQQYAASQKVNAMNSYLEAMTAQDPIDFIFKKYKCETERVAKNKLYQWQHNYGTNLNMIRNKVKDLQLEIAASQLATDNQTKKAEEKAEQKTDTKAEEISQEEKITKKKEEKISKNYLEQTRADLEKEFILKESEIEKHKDAIRECEHRMDEITEQIKALRQVLDIFKKKEGD